MQLYIVIGGMGGDHSFEVNSVQEWNLNQNTQQFICEITIGADIQLENHLENMNIKQQNLLN